MTRLHVINPNTARAMTETIGRRARAVAGPHTRIEAITPASGPASIESHYDDALAAVGVLAEITAAPHADAYVIACFGDPGLHAARELAAGPVVGIAEAAMHTATLLGRTFSVVTTLARTAPHTRDLAEQYGFARALAGVHATGIAVLDLHHPPARRQIFDACAAALDRDGSDVLVLGCAGMADLADDLAEGLSVPVVEGVGAAVKLAEGLVGLGLRTGKRHEYAPPPPKPVTGLLAPYSLN
ncbi:aspartate/glutamate racemase family protein [Actinocorallia sp. A-T 12471]|uniref:aspartate/glutamate racemase family protein n=1 Tax=Actinocorallia sp. A-T 12471 TaxID=3089813 RepID=UPI0029D3A7E9|nr:aspartate/glutamate racemase family protein [Actinocorallia sp. A-T 12471]MDX6743980.1 aspartate/glutamate racemase family protein [Actinocorallia sp. A-T 12471]